jgi:hypothetical protein
LLSGSSDQAERSADVVEMPDIGREHLVILFEYPSVTVNQIHRPRTDQVASDHADRHPDRIRRPGLCWEQQGHAPIGVLRVADVALPLGEKARDIGVEGRRSRERPARRLSSQALVALRAVGGTSRKFPFCPHQMLL